MRRFAIACAVFALGIGVGIAVLNPGHGGRTAQERHAAAAVAGASGGHVVRAACVADHCGVVVRVSGSSVCQGWVVPIAAGTLGVPKRSALVEC